jgi:hypothetical protein
MFRIILFLLMLPFISIAQRGTTYPIKYERLAVVDVNPDTNLDSIYGSLAFNVETKTLHVNQGGSAWADVGNSSIVIDNDSIFVGSVGESVPYSSNVFQTLTVGNVDALVHSTRGGVTISANEVNGEISFGIPSGCELNSVTLAITSAVLDGSNNLYVNFDYAGLRTYNTTVEDVLIPSFKIASNIAPSRITPMTFRNRGVSNIIYGVSSVGGGDGSDLEVALKGVTESPSMVLSFTF